MSESLDYKNYLFPLSALNIYEFPILGAILTFDFTILHFKNCRVPSHADIRDILIVANIYYFFSFLWSHSVTKIDFCNGKNFTL